MLLRVLVPPTLLWGVGGGGRSVTEQNAKDLFWTGCACFYLLVCGASSIHTAVKFTAGAPPTDTKKSD